MTPARNALRAAVERATPGPWAYTSPDMDGSVWIDPKGRPDAPIAMMMSGSPHEQDLRDAALIVAAVNALPHLLDALDEADQQLRDATTAAHAKGLEDAAGLREAAAELVDKLDAIHADSRYEAVWTIAQLHAGPYAGPTYTDELSALRQAIVAASEGGGA